MRQFLSILLVCLCCSALPAIAKNDPAADLLAALTQWREWNPESAPRKMAAVTAALAGGASVTVADAAGRTPLHYAAIMGNPELVLLLLSKGASVDQPDQQGRTPLLLAAMPNNYYWNQQMVVTLLLERGASRTPADADGATVLLHAVHNPDTGILSALLAGQPPFSATDPSAGDLLIEAVRSRNPAALPVLYAHGASLDAPDAEGRTTLMRALQVLDSAALRELLAAAPAGAGNINSRGPRQWTALMIAARTRDAATVGLLLDCGAASELIDDDCLAALDHAGASKQPDRDATVKLLRQRGAGHGVGHWFPYLLGLALLLLVLAFILARQAMRPPKK